MNTINLIGRIGTNPELKFTKDDKAVAEFRLAVEDPYTEDPDWFTIVAWGKLAETIAEHKSQGDQVGVTGSLKSQQWETEDGQKRSTVKIRAERIDFLARKRTDQGEQ